MVAAALLISSGGCSVMFMTPARSLGAPNPACTDSSAAPGVDTAFALLEALALFTAYNSPAGFANVPFSRTGQVRLGFALLVGHGISAGYGFSNASDCHKILTGKSQDSLPTRRLRNRRLTAPPTDLEPPPMPPPREPAAAPAPAQVAPPADAPEIAPPPPPSAPAPGQQPDDE